MKKLLTFAAALLFGFSAFADDSDFHLYYDSATDGTVNTQLSAVANIQKITFENGKVVLTQKDGKKVETAISAIKRLFFSTPENVGINAPEMDTVAKNGEAYDLTGRKLRIDISKTQLPKGIYIIDGKKVLVK